jgi:uncharacterized membrane protein YdbT with pleckstrin-like domain
MISKKKLFTKDSGEKVIMHLWQHPFIFLKIFLFYCFLFLIPIGCYFFALYFFPEILSNSVLISPLSVLAYIYYLTIFLLTFNFWVEEYLDIRTITNKRVISREYLGLFNRTVSELELYRIQDVSVDQKGFFATILNYGNVSLQTAGAQEKFMFKNIANPVEVSRLIQKLDKDDKKLHHYPTQ